MWQTEILLQLFRDGHEVAVRHDTGRPVGRWLDRILGFEGSRSAGSLVHRDVAPIEREPVGQPVLTIDFTGHAAATGVPHVTLAFNGRLDLEDGLAAMLTDASGATVVAQLDGQPVAQARPMLSDRVWLGRDASALVAGSVTLAGMCVHRFSAGTLEPQPTAPVANGFGAASLPGRYVRHLVGALARRAWAKLMRRRPFYWRTAYRLIDGPGIAERGGISGERFVELPDDGERFYADPFAFEWQGRHFLFVEEYPYADGKGLISVAELGADGTFGRPLPIISEAHHLSYPYVFAHDGAVYLIPEASGGGELVLYRAAEFPQRWERAAVLVRGHRLNDMTMLVRDGRFWLFGTEQIGNGSASDTMVAWTAPALTGPWTPHAQNPILIDHSAARPGGRFIERDGRTYLPVQNGSDRYGGGLGLAELETLSADEIRFGPVVPIATGEAWSGREVHTLTRAGRLEAIDSAMPA